MNTHRMRRLALTIATGVIAMTSPQCQAKDSPAGRTRPAAVAGQFYTGSAAALRREVEKYMSEATATLPSPTRMIVSPHAGYVFSAAVAANAYAVIDHSVTTAILLGPSHNAWFEGLSIADVDSYETPLGRVAFDRDMVAALRKSPLVHSVPEADGPEHCLEVQLPFLQVVVPQCRIVPIIMGHVDPAKVADLIRPLITERTLVIASSDLSHYKTHEQATATDKASIDVVLKSDLTGKIDACGEAPIRVLMHLAKAQGLKAVLLDARNSYETAPVAYRDKSRVVGYASIAFVAGDSPAGGKAEAAAKPAAAETKTSDDVDEATKAYLLKLARAALEASVRGQKAPSTADAPKSTRSPSGCFVTLHKRGELRGCVGYIEPVKPLADAVVDMAKNAALHDTRFSPVTPDELSAIDVEVSVLTPPRSLEFSGPDDLLAKLVPGRDGVILKKGWYQSTFLPQVWDQLPDKVGFLQHLSLKAGMDADGWKDAKVETYRAIHFAEKK